MISSDKESGPWGVDINRKADDSMTGKEVVKLIRKLREKGMSGDEIIAIIEYIETHDPKEQE